MKLAVLFSGGKDSNFALFEASKKHNIECLITLVPKNKESYMFQTAGNEFVKFQAKALKIPILEVETNGVKEKELDDLKKGIIDAINKYNIEGIVTGAIKSAYQSSRIQKICHELDLWCFNPLWQKNEEQFIEELIENKFKPMIIGVFGYPLDSTYIGKILDEKLFERLKQNSKFINCAGEGGEYESFIIDGPTFKKRIDIKEFEINMDSENSGIMNIKKMELIDK